MNHAGCGEAGQVCVSRAAVGVWAFEAGAGVGVSAKLHQRAMNHVIFGEAGQVGVSSAPEGHFQRRDG